MPAASSTSTRRRAFSWSANTPAWMYIGSVPGDFTAGAFTTVTGGGAAGAMRGNAEPGSGPRREHAHFDGCGALAQHVEPRRGGVRQVDDAVADERPAVVDAHDHLWPFLRLVTRAYAGSGRVLCAAVIAYMS